MELDETLWDACVCVPVGMGVGDSGLTCFAAHKLPPWNWTERNPALRAAAIGASC